MDFTTINNTEKAEILQLVKELEEALTDNSYITNRTKKITKIINKYDTTGKTK